MQQQQHEHHPQAVQRFGALAIDRQAHEVTLDHQPVTLTRAEYELLSTLAASPGKAISARTLLSAIWNTDWEIDIAPLHVLISRLRRKLGESGRTPRHLIAVRGYGYRFDPHPKPASSPSPRPAGIATQPVQALISASNTLLWLSDNVHALLGIPAHQLKGQDVCSLVHPAHREASLAAAHRASAGSATDFTWRPRTDATRPALIHACVRPMIDLTETVRAYLVEWSRNARDIDRPAPAGNLTAIRIDA